MTKDQIRKIFNIPERDLLCFLLSKINLTEKEKEVVENYYAKGYTEEETAEIMDMSKNGVQKIKKKAYDKIVKVWQNDRIIKILLEETD